MRVLGGFLALWLQVSVAHAGVASVCEWFANNIFYRQELSEARAALETSFGKDFEAKIARLKELELRYLLRSPQALSLVSDHIRKATRIDISKNPQLKASQVLALLAANAATLEDLDLRGLRINRDTFDVIAYSMPKLKRLRIDAMPWFALKKLKGHPALVELDIRKAGAFWFEIRDFLQEIPPKLRWLKVGNHRKASFIDELRDIAHSKKATLEVQSYFDDSVVIRNFQWAPNYARVLDGDTFRVSLNDLGGALGSNVSLRLKDMDAPELGEKAESEGEAKVAIAARYFLYSLLKGQKVVLDDLEEDKYSGRFVADVSVGGRSVFHEMVSRKLALYYPFDLDSKKPKADWDAIYRENQAFYDDLIARSEAEEKSR